MTLPPHQPDPSPRTEQSELPKNLIRDLKRVSHSEGDMPPPSRVDDAVFAAASTHFAKQPVLGESKPGVLGWIGRRPLHSAWLGGALIAASVLVVVLVVSPNQPGPGDRSVAMEAQIEPEAPIAGDTPATAAREMLDAAPEPPAPLVLPEELADSAESELADRVMGLARRRARDDRTSQEQIRGDVDGDGAVTIADALLLARMVESSGGTLDEPRYDMLGNGSVSRADADAIARLVVRLAPAPSATPNPEGAS